MFRVHPQLDRHELFQQAQYNLQIALQVAKRFPDMPLDNNLVDEIQIINRQTFECIPLIPLKIEF